MNNVFSRFLLFEVFAGILVLLLTAEISAELKCSALRVPASAPSCEAFINQKSFPHNSLALFVDRTEFMTGKIKPVDIPAFSYIAPDGSFYTIINMALVSPDSIFDQAVQNYLRKKNKDLKERVPKFRDDARALEKLEKADKDVRNRTIMVLNTVRPIDELLPGEDNFLGGGRVVVAESGIEKLPFQLPLPLTSEDRQTMTPKEIEAKEREDNWLINFHRSKGPSAEIGALNSSKAAIPNPYRSVEVINSCIQILQNLNISETLVHTSLLHVELYKKMNLSPIDVNRFDRKNIVLRYGLQEDWGLKHFNVVKPAFEAPVETLERAN